MRSVKEVIRELDKVVGDYKKALENGDEARAKELTDRKNELETEREWLMI